MMRKVFLPLLPAFIFIGINNSLIAQDLKDSLDQILSGLYENSDLPGFAAAIVNAEGVLYQNAFGYADLETQTPFTPKTRVNIASVSKTFLGLALQKAVEQGKLSLDSPVNDFLPFEVKHPHFPDKPITIRHLACHTSGLYDYKIEFKSVFLTEAFNLQKGDISKESYKYLKSWSQNRKTAMAAFLKEALTTEGRFYHKKRFSKTAPGAKYQYSNLGTSLAALALEVATGESYGDYVTKHIIQALNLTATSWIFDEESEENRAANYFQNQIRTPRYASILYPAGGLISNCEDLSTYLIEMIKGRLGQSRLLDRSSFQLMMSPQLNSLQSPPSKGRNYGLFWEINGSQIGHNGGNYGLIVFLALDSQTNVGKIFLTNISSYEDSSLIPEMLQIWKSLDKYGAKY